MRKSIEKIADAYFCTFAPLFVAHESIAGPATFGAREKPRSSNRPIDKTAHLHAVRRVPACAESAVLSLFAVACLFVELIDPVLPARRAARALPSDHVVRLPVVLADVLVRARALIWFAICRAALAAARRRDGGDRSLFRFRSSRPAAAAVRRALACRALACRALGRLALGLGRSLGRDRSLGRARSLALGRARALAGVAHALPQK